MISSIWIFLIDEAGTYSLIDWEYAGMSDEANDFGTFAVCCELTDDEANAAIDYYLEKRQRLSSADTSGAM